MFDFKDAPSSSGFQYSSLTEEDLQTITEAEEKLSRHHNSNEVLIAYRKADEPGQPGRA